MHVGFGTISRESDESPWKVQKRHSGYFSRYFCTDHLFGGGVDDIDARSEDDVVRLCRAAAYEVPAAFFKLAGTPPALENFDLSRLPSYGPYPDQAEDSLAMKLRRVGEGCWEHLGDWPDSDDDDEAA